MTHGLAAFPALPPRRLTAEPGFIRFQHRGPSCHPQPPGPDAQQATPTCTRVFPGPGPTGRRVCEAPTTEHSFPCSSRSRLQDDPGPGPHLPARSPSLHPPPVALRGLSPWRQVSAMTDFPGGGRAWLPPLTAKPLCPPSAERGPARPTRSPRRKPCDRTGGSGHPGHVQAPHRGSLPLGPSSSSWSSPSSVHCAPTRGCTCSHARCAH